MKKLSLLLALSIGLFTAQAQSWSSHLLTNDLPLVVINGQQTVPVGDLRVLPDAITTNHGNPNSMYQENSVFTAFSPSGRIHGGGDSRSWTNPNNLGTWIIGKTVNGTTILSRKIQVQGHFLRIWSLQYDAEIGDEMLVFTGSIVSTTDIGRGHTNQMVVGTYNLKTNMVSLDVIDQPHSYIYEGQLVNSKVASQGIGVRKVDANTNNFYMAIGQHTGEMGAQFPNGFPRDPWMLSSINSAYFPIGVIFDIQSNGAVSIQFAEVKDFMFKAHTVADPYPNVNSDGIGTSIVAGGFKVLSELTSENPGHPDYLPGCPHPENPALRPVTLIAPAAYTFDAEQVGSNWSITVENGIHHLTEEYAATGFGMWWPSVHVFVEHTPTRRVFLATMGRRLCDIPTNITLNVSHLLFYEHNLSSSGNYSLLKRRKYILKDGRYASVQRLLANAGHPNFDVVLNVDDAPNGWGRPNNTSIGKMSLPKADIEQIGASIPFKSIYADDLSSGHETEIRNTTGINIPANPNGDYFSYLVADGFEQPTLLSRAHFNCAFPGRGFRCEDQGNTYNQTFNNKDRPEGDTKPKLGQATWNSAPTNVAHVSYGIWACENYNAGGSRGETAIHENISESKPELSQIEADSYVIKNTPETITDYEFFTVSGQSIAIPMTENTFTMKDLTPGIYMVRYQVSGKTYTNKILVD